MSYHSGFLLAVPTANRQEYADHAAKSWPMFQKRGALRLVEAWGVDVSVSTPRIMRALVEEAVQGIERVVLDP